MSRYFVAFTAVVVGGLIAAADLYVSLPLLPPGQRQAAHSPERDRLIFDACLAFFGAAYPTGRLLYRWLKAHPEAQELHHWSRWHLLVLKLFGGVWLLASGWPALRQEVVRPSLLVGIVLIVWAAYNGWRKLRAAQSKPPVL